MEGVLGSWGGQAVSAMDVYADVFRLGSGAIQRDGEDGGSFKTNPIIIGKKGNGRVARRIMFEDTFEETLTEFQGYDWAFLNGLTYWGRRNDAASQSKMYAMVFDLDGVTPKTLNNFLSGALNAGAYPVPNYVVLSGHGVHLYYVFEEPVSFYPNTKTQMKALKYALTDKMWNQYTSTDKHVQHQGINQGFRIVGGKTKIDGVRVKAYRVNTHPVTVEQLNEFVPEDKRVDMSKVWPESRMTLAEAKEKYKEWYERRILGNAPRGTWQAKEDLYRWWIRQIESGATYGHRYFCVMCLAIYAVKCGIFDKERVKSDAMSLLPFLDGLNPDDPFTESDVDSALECLDERYITFPRDDISALSGIWIPKNKRNYRKQPQHMEYLNGLRKMRRDILGEDEYGKNGRPKGSGTKRDLIREYAIDYPDASHSEIARALGVSRPTVVKWLKPGWRAEWRLHDKDTEGLPPGAW